MIVFAKFGLLIVLLIVLLRLKAPLAAAIMAISAAQVLLSGMSLETAGRAVIRALSDLKTIELFAIIIIVIFIGETLKNHRLFDRLILSLNGLVRDARLVAMAAPAIIGLLPMPGGALFSAPLVDTSTREMKIEPAFRAFLNYWFRHLWEFVWPVYAGLLIFHAMSGIPLRTIILWQSPFTLLNLGSGLALAWYHFRRQGVQRTVPPRSPKNRLLSDLLLGTWPILAVILLFFVFSIPLHYALLAVSLVLVLVLRVRPGEICKTIFSRSMGKILLVIAAVMIFQHILQASDSFSALAELRISLPAVVLFAALVSFTVGFLTGVNTAYIIIAYPIVLPLIANLPNAVFLSLYVYIIGFAGILLSPLHLCLVLSNEYFCTSLLKVYRYMALPVALQVIAATLAALLL